MQALRVAVLFLAACRSNERADLAAAHISDLQRRIGTLEATTADLRRALEVLTAPSWWCTADRCERAPSTGAAPTTLAWCRLGAGLETCRATLTACGEGCVGVQ